MTVSPKALGRSVGRDDNGGMTGRALGWTGGIVAVAASAGLAVHFAVVGLDKADKLASAIGVFVGLAGLVLGGFGLVMSHRQARTGAADGQSVTGTRVGGGIAQVRNVRGNVRLRPAPSAPAAGDPAAAAPDPTAPRPASGGQSVTDAHVGGSVHQIDDVGGDLDIGR
ncbi:hypothetical protein [Thermomonospora cellulosilytica]|uniref:Uncharacterized protein n=1 Tax=Thermomonospora cellulosilytica TaxID=1411118 RepID=A0A7W3N071_9ACTN|nr:hypothetical protein [Thermomonospora cellulosilytica]MBA9005141.1 hypothetical protein [Thermomonospora cellulosilytica]